jgi:serine/threonine-protein kinase
MCRERAGQLASAWANYAQVASHSKREGRGDREQAARDKLAELEPRLSRLAISVDPVTAQLPGLVVTRDGAPVGEGAWDTGVPVDGGTHTVEATATGMKPWGSKVSIGAERDMVKVSVPVLEAAPSTSAAATPATATSGPVASPDRAAPSEGFPLRTVGLAVGGAGVVGLVVGSIFGLKAKGALSDSKADNHCDAQNKCDATGGAARDDAGTFADVATVSFIAGGVLAAAGVTLYLVGGPKKESTSAWLGVAPALGRGDAGVVARGSF